MGHLDWQRPPSLAPYAPDTPHPSGLSAKPGSFGLRVLGQRTPGPDDRQVIIGRFGETIPMQPAAAPSIASTRRMLCWIVFISAITVLSGGLALVQSGHAGPSLHPTGS